MTLIVLTVLAVVGLVVQLVHPEFFAGVGPALAMAGVIDASTWADKMIRKAEASGGDWEAGVKNPSTSPTAAMKKAKGRYKTEMTASITEDRWGKAIDRLSDADIVAGALAAGGARFVSGITSRRPKIVAAIAQLQPLVQALQQRLDGMPIDTDQQREAKMIEAKRGMQLIGRQLAGTAR